MKLCHELNKTVTDVKTFIKYCSVKADSQGKPVWQCYLNSGALYLQQIYYILPWHTNAVVSNQWIKGGLSIHIIIFYRGVLDFVWVGWCWLSGKMRTRCWRVYFINKTYKQCCNWLSWLSSFSWNFGDWVKIHWDKWDKMDERSAILGNFGYEMGNRAVVLLKKCYFSYYSTVFAVLLQT